MLAAYHKTKLNITCTPFTLSAQFCEELSSNSSKRQIRIQLCCTGLVSYEAEEKYTNKAGAKGKGLHYYYYLYNILDNLLALWFGGVYIYPQGNKGIKCPRMSTDFSTSIKIKAGKKKNIQVQTR